MKYVQPVGQPDNAPYVGRNLAAGGSTGSRPPAAAIEHPQREIVNAISAAGLTPAQGDLTQLTQASRILAQQAIDRIQIAGVAAAIDTLYQPGVTLPAGAFSRLSAATLFDARGTLQNAATDVARVTADARTGANRGLLVEASRTNSLPNNTMQGAVAGGALPTGWAVATTGGLATSVVGVGSENGVEYVELLISGVATGSAYQLGFHPGTSIAAAVGQSWAASFFARATGALAGATAMQLGLYGRNSAVIVQTAYTPFALPAASAALGASRFSGLITLTDPATNAVQIVFRMTMTPGETVSVPIRIGLPQLEVGSYVSSPIRTSTVAVTRAADVYSESASSWFNPVEGAFYLSFYFDGSVLGQRLFSVSDGSINNTLEVSRTTAGYPMILNLTLAAAPVFSINSAVIPSAGVNRLVLSYGPTETILVLNGVVIVQTAASPPLAALTTFKYGRANNTMQTDAGILRRAYFPRALSQEVARRMTTPAVSAP